MKAIAFGLALGTLFHILFRIWPKIEAIEEKIYAIEERLESKGDLAEHPYRGSGRQAPEASGGYSTL